jgi:SulP family sulfate permease
MLLALVVAVLYIIMAVLQLGIVTAFMPEPALGGFTSGAAIVIVTSQLKHFVGMPNVPRGSVPVQLAYIVTHFDTVPNVATFLMGLFSLLVLIALKATNGHPKVKAKLPIPIPEQLVVLIFAILISLAADLNGNFQVPIVGTVPGKVVLLRLVCSLYQELVLCQWSALWFFFSLIPIHHPCSFTFFPNNQLE